MTVFDFLGIVLLVLKLVGVISIGWGWIVLCFVPTILIWCFTGVVLILALIGGLLGGR